MTVLVAASLLTACGARDQTAAPTTMRDSARTTPSPMREDDLRRVGATFTPKAIRACLERAPTSLGIPMVDPDPYAGGLTAREGLFQYWVLQSDVGLPGVTIGFVGDHAARARFHKTAFAWESGRRGPYFARTLVFRQRGNVVFYYEKGTSAEVVRIAEGCLGGPP